VIEDDVLFELDRIKDEYDDLEIQYDVDIKDGLIDVIVYTYIQESFLVFFSKKVKKIISRMNSKELGQILESFEILMSLLSQPPSGLQDEIDENI